MSSSLVDILSSMSSDAELTIWYSDSELCDVVVTREGPEWFYSKDEVLTTCTFDTILDTIGTPFKYEYNPDIYA
jgi:hypothetical protein